MTLPSANRRWTLRAAVSVLGVVGFFLVFAGNPTGTAASQAEVPGVPRNIQVQLGHSGDLVASWRAPDSDGGSAITGYKVQWKEAADSWDTPTSVSETMVTGTSHTISGLTDGTEYTVRIIAVNGIGDGPPSSEETCPGGYDPEPTPVEVEAVPIVVESTTEEYFVLYVKHDLDGTEVELPVSVTLGQDGTTTLAENVEALPAERYRVEKYLIADPADVDGDCVDDITELGNLGNMNPVNPAAAIPLSGGVVVVPDAETFKAISYTSRHGKFVLIDMDTASPRVYFINITIAWNHRVFLEAIGLDPDQDGLFRGQLNYDPEMVAPDGGQGVYFYSLHDNQNTIPPYSTAARFHTVLAANTPLLDNNLALHVSNHDLPDLQDDLPLYRASRIPLLSDQDVYQGTNLLALNPGEGYGRLRVMELDERPNPRDIVLYEALPNELPRIAGIITSVPQTPLSHVNLRAIQDGVPNVFIRDALDEPEIALLIDRYVHFTVTEDGYTIRAATPEEVDAHHAMSRPTHPQTPERDLSVTAITPLSEIGFDDWESFGVKAANVAVLRTLGLPDGTVPDGFAVPFYFYDEFMKHNGFYDDIEEMLADPDFQADFDVQEDELKDLRKAIKKGETPEWMTEALTTMHGTYPEGQSLRYRSSTNNEDLPGFNGAGLYDSKTQHPEETEEDGVAKSLKQVYASLWNFRAFTERDFHRIDHLAAAMGVLVHPNYSDELANGVAVSFDPMYGIDGTHYVNTQVGENLVTNPDAHSVPEEIVLFWPDFYPDFYRVRATSNQVEPGQLIMSDDQMGQLRQHTEVIHEEFAELYNPAPDDPFAMEIEFKITSEDILAIKQARPWVFSQTPADVASDTNTPAIGQPTISGTAHVGETLTAETAAINDDDGLSNVVYSYQWLADDTEIAGATDPTYTLVDADAGLTIKVKVSFFDDKNNPETLTSAATTAVAAETAAPDAPQSLNVSLDDTGTLDVSWEAPASDGGSAITGYKVQWKRAADSWDTPADVFEATVSRTTHTITGLTDGVEYAVRIIAANDVGEGPPSDEATGTPRETTPPELSTATVDGATLTLTYDEDLDENSEPSSDAFSVTVGGTGRAVDGTAVEGDTVTLTLASAVTAEETVTVSYAVPTDAAAPRIQDDAGNPAASFSDQDVENNTPPPANSPATGAPTISGTAQVGETLTADISGIGDDDGLPAESEFDYQWIRNDGSTDANIAGATDSTYVLLAADVGKFINVRVTFTDKNDYPETMTSAATTAVEAAAPAPGPITGFTVVDASDQTVEGALADGGTLALDDPDGGSYGIRADLESGATIGSMSLELTGEKTHDQTENITPYSLYGDSGGNLSGESLPVGEYTLTATAYSEARLGGNVLGTLKVSFSVTATQQTNTPATGLPTINGTAQVGKTLTASASDIDDADGIGNATFSYEWIAGTTDITGATGSTYTLVADDVGKAIRVRVSFDDDRNFLETLTSEATATVVTPLTAGFRDAPDKHLGTGVFTFKIAFSEPISISYATLRDDSLEVTNGSATKAKRVNGQSDLWQITVEPDSDADVTVVLPVTGDCTAQDAVCTRDGTELSNRSELTVPGPAAANSPATGAPIISGTARVGETLTVGTSGIDDADGLDNVGYSYQWLANGADIAGATSSSYTLVEADKGKTIQVKVSFRDDKNNPETLTSEATAAVAAETATPDAPQSLNVSLDDTGTLDVSWEAPASDGGSAITGYKVQWKRAADSWDTPADVFEATVSRTTHTITGLTDGVEYTVRAIAVNDVGDGPPSDEATGTPRETTPPELSTATVDGAALTLTYDEDLDENSEPSADAFSVTVGGLERAVDGVSVSGSSVILTLGSAVTAADTVTVTYTVPTDAAALRIQDDAGNPAASFSDQDVENNTPPPANTPATGAPTITGTAQVGKTLTASTSDIDDADGLDNVGYSYQWLANGLDIAGATSDTYTLVDADLEKAVKVRVSFRDDKNNSETLTSAATAGVTAAADDSAVWSATLTVGSIADFRGFWKDVGMGELTSEVFTLDGVDYTVKVLADSDGPQFYLTLDKALPVGFTLQVGTTTLSSQDASIREFSSGATQYGWATNQEAILADVDTVEVSLTLAE